MVLIGFSSYFPTIFPPRISRHFCILIPSHCRFVDTKSTIKLIINKYRRWLETLNSLCYALCVFSMKTKTQIKTRSLSICLLNEIDSNWYYRIYVESIDDRKQFKRRPKFAFFFCTKLWCIVLSCSVLCCVGLDCRANITNSALIAAIVTRLFKWQFAICLSIQFCYQSIFKIVYKIVSSRPVAFENKLVFAIVSSEDTLYCDSAFTVSTFGKFMINVQLYIVAKLCDKMLSFFSQYTHSFHS